MSENRDKCGIFKVENSHQKGNYKKKHKKQNLIAKIKNRKKFLKKPCFHPRPDDTHTQLNI